MTAPAAISQAFADPVRESQAAFRAVMNAMARPGQIIALQPAFRSPAPLLPSAAALLLTLCDFETSIWLDPALADTPAVRTFITFQTGTRLVESHAEADFAVISDATRMPQLASFALGTADYPDRSTTLIIAVQTLSSEGWKLEGPGIRGSAGFSAAPLPDDFAGQVRANRALFPRGVDMYFTTETEIAALPRSVVLTESG